MVDTSTYTLDAVKDDDGRVVSYRVQFAGRTVGSICKLIPTVADPRRRYAPTYWRLGPDGEIEPEEVGLFDKLTDAINAILDKAGAPK
jgi:hypothetical protein